MSISFSCEVLVCSVLYVVVQFGDFFYCFVISIENLSNTLCLFQYIKFLECVNFEYSVKFVNDPCSCTVIILVVL